MSRVTRPSCEGKKKFVLSQEKRIYIGIDVHKHSYSVAEWGEHFGLIQAYVMDARPDVLRSMLDPIRERIRGVVYEAGPTGFSLARTLRNSGLRTEVVVTGRIPRPASNDTKTDRTDCVTLAEYASKGLLKYVAIPDERQDADRQILRLREQALHTVQKIKCRIKSFLLYNGIEEPAGLKNWSRTSETALRDMALSEELRFNLDARLDELSFAESQLRKIDARILKMERSKRYRENSAILRTCPAVGVMTAMTMLTELIRPERFQDEREAAKMMGLSPRIFQTGLMRHDCGLSASGNRRLRTCLIEAAWRWKRRDSRASDRYDRLKKNTGSGKKAIVGLARKMGVILWRMMTRGEAYRSAG